MVSPTSHFVALVQTCFESAISLRLRFICGVEELVEWSSAREERVDRREAGTAGSTSVERGEVEMGKHTETKTPKLPP